MSAVFLVHGSLDEFSIPSDDMIDYIKINLSDKYPLWSYCATTWYIMKDWVTNNNEENIKGLKFAKDHKALAKRINKPTNINDGDI